MARRRSSGWPPCTPPPRPWTSRASAPDPKTCQDLRGEVSRRRPDKVRDTPGDDLGLTRGVREDACMATKTPSRTTSSSRPSVRQRLGAVMEANVVESTIDRVMTKRLRPLRDELKAARLALTEQAALRVDAEVRAVRAEDEVAALRVRLAEIEQVQVTTEEARASSSWWRRRRVAEQQTA